jgi:predicted secreted protein
MVRFSMKALVFVLLALFMVLGLGSAAFAASWPDLDSSILTAYGLTTDQVSQVSVGYVDGTWQPWRSVTQAQFLKMAKTGFNTDSVDLAGIDVPGSAAEVTREQAVGVIARLAAAGEGYDLSGMTQEEIAGLLADFGDAGSIGTALRAEMAFAISRHLIKGNNLHNLAPRAVLSRIAAAALVIRATGPQLRVDATDNGSTMTVKAGDIIQVVLKGNPTTGYTWAVALSEKDASILQQMGAPGYVPDSQLTGSGGTFTFRFKALKAGEALLKLVYARSWESVPPLETFSMTVRVVESPLDGTAWRLAGWSVSSLNPADFEITASFKEGRISGKAAVNSYSGPYTIGANGSLAVGMIMRTLMAGSGPAMQAEGLYFQLLAQARVYRLTGGGLTLLDANGNELLIFAPALQYVNNEYGFTFALPESWRGYTIVSQQWLGHRLGSVVDLAPAYGPEILIRHPLWTQTSPRQDIPIMVFTLAQWQMVEQEKLSVGAAPIPPSELGRNAVYVFALPARYNFAFQTGFEEVEQIMAGQPLQPLTK